MVSALCEAGCQQVPWGEPKLELSQGTVVIPPLVCAQQQIKLPVLSWSCLKPLPVVGLPQRHIWGQQGLLVLAGDPSGKASSV